MTEIVEAGGRRFDRRTVLGAGAGLAAAGLVFPLDALPNVAAQGATTATGLGDRVHLADPNWQIVEVADNHFGPVNAPELTADALLSLA